MTLDNFFLFLSRLFYDFNIPCFFVVDHLWLLVIKILLYGVHLQQIQLPLEFKVESFDVSVVIAETSGLVANKLSFDGYHYLINL